MLEHNKLNWTKMGHFQFILNGYLMFLISWHSVIGSLKSTNLLDKLDGDVTEVDAKDDAHDDAQGSAD